MYNNQPPPPLHQDELLDDQQQQRVSHLKIYNTRHHQRRPRFTWLLFEWAKFCARAPSSSPRALPDLFLVYAVQHQGGRSISLSLDAAGVHLHSSSTCSSRREAMARDFEFIMHRRMRMCSSQLMVAESRAEGREETQRRHCACYFRAIIFLGAGNMTKKQLISLLFFSLFFREKKDESAASRKSDQFLNFKTTIFASSISFRKTLNEKSIAFTE